MSTPTLPDAALGTRPFAIDDLDAVVASWRASGPTPPWNGFCRTLGDVEDEAVCLRKRVFDAPDGDTS